MTAETAQVAGRDARQIRTRGPESRGCLSDRPISQVWERRNLPEQVVSRRVKRGHVDHQTICSLPVENKMCCLAVAQQLADTRILRLKKLRLSPKSRLPQTDQKYSASLSDLGIHQSIGRIRSFGPAAPAS